MRVAVLDDYFNKALDLADWSPLEGRAEVSTRRRGASIDYPAFVLEDRDVEEAMVRTAAIVSVPLHAGLTSIARVRARLAEIGVQPARDRRCQSRDRQRTHRDDGDCTEASERGETEHAHVSVVRAEV